MDMDSEAESILPWFIRWLMRPEFKLGGRPPTEDLSLLGLSIVLYRANFEFGFRLGAAIILLPQSPSPHGATERLARLRGQSRGSH